MSDTFTCQFCGEKLPSADTFHDLASCYAHLKVRIDSLEAENARLKEENERLYLLYQEAVEIIESADTAPLAKRITAFAGQLQAWGYENAARELISEILGGIVDAPDYYTLQDELASRDALIERLIEAGNVLVDQNDMDNGAVMAAEDEWRFLVTEWKAMKGGE